MVQILDKTSLNWGEKSSITMQNPDFVLPWAVSKIVCKPPGSKQHSSRTDETHMWAPAGARPGDVAALGPSGHDLPPAHHCPSLLLTQPYVLILDKYSYCTYFISVKHHQPLSFGHWHKTASWYFILIQGFEIWHFALNDEWNLILGKPAPLPNSHIQPGMECSSADRCEGGWAR